MFPLLRFGRYNLIHPRRIHNMDLRRLLDLHFIFQLKSNLRQYWPLPLLPSSMYSDLKLPFKLPLPMSMLFTQNPLKVSRTVMDACHCDRSCHVSGLPLSQPLGEYCTLPVFLDLLDAEV